MYAVTSSPFVSRTRATLRSAEFGFLGVVVYTRVHTPRFWGQLRSAGAPVLLRSRRRPCRTSWLRVGTEYLQAVNSFGNARRGRARHPRGRNMRRNRADRAMYPYGILLSSCLCPLVLDHHRLGLDRSLALAFEPEPPVGGHPGPRRDQVTDDHVLLQAPQEIHLALDRGLGEHPGRLLEGGRRDEAVGRERGLGDPEQQWL